MANIVCQAIEIITNVGTGLVSSYTNTDIGLYSDGHFYLVTDRPGLDGSKTIAGDTTRTIWKEGVLVKGTGMQCSRSIDIIEGGNISSASSFEFQIKNTDLFWNTLNQNSVYLGRCVVKYYLVKSTDGTTYTFHLRWTGLIDDQPFDETTYTVNCIDNSKSVFTSVPPTEVNSASFPEAIKESLGKSIPVAIGRVPYSPMVGVVSSGKRTILVTLLGVDYPVVGAWSYSAATRTLTLATLGRSFQANDVNLVGKYLSVVKGTEQARKIVSNSATFISNTDIVIDSPLEDGASFVAWGPTTLSTSVWYFEVSSYSNTLLASTNPIYQFNLHRSGRKSLYSYDSEIKDYVDNSELVDTSSTSSIASTGYPGMRIVSKSQDAKGDIDFYYPIYPTDIKLSGIDSLTISDGLAVDDSARWLFDKNKSTSYTITAVTDGTISFDLYFPKNEINKTFDNLYVLFDWAERFESGTFGAVNRLSVSGKDFYQRSTDPIINFYMFKNGTVGSTFVDVDRLPFKYYGEETGDDDDFYIHKNNYEITSFISDIKSYTVYNVLTVTFSFSPSAGQYEFKLKELGIVAKRSVDVSSEAQYTSLKGEMFGSGWGGRKTATDPILLLGDSVEHILRTFDHNYPLWAASTAYLANTVIKSRDDNNHLYIVTTAGTSAANADITGAVDNGSGLIRITAASHGQATGNAITISGVAGTTEANGNWTLTVITANTYDLQGSTFANAYVSGGTVRVNYSTTSGASFTDGTVTWKELRTIPLKTSAFDSFNALRAGWFVGRTLTDKKKTDEVILEMAKQGFFGLITTSNGQLAPKSWVDNTTSLVTFSSANIFKGTLSDIALSPMRRVYNELVLKYDPNPGSGGHNNQVVVTQVDKAAFPAQDSIDSVSLGVTVTALTLHSVFGTLLIQITCSADPDINPGDYAVLSGASNGFDFVNRLVLGRTANNVVVAGHLTTSSTGTGGSFTKAVGPLNWQKYVIGVREYQTAKGIWENCHASYIVTKAVQKLPEDLGNCKWFIDPYAKDPYGNEIWEDDGIDVGDEHPAVFLARFLSQWITWQKKQVSFETSISDTNLTLELLDCVTFNDAKYTNSIDRVGWIHEIVDLPATDDKPLRLKIGITLSPDQLAACNKIIDTDDAANRIIDTNAAANRVLDTPC